VRRRSVPLVGLWLGLLAGLGEGPLSLLLLRFGHLREIGYDVLWVAPVVDAGLGVVAAVGLATLARLARRPARALRMAVLGSGFITASIWLGLLLPWQVHTWALVLLSAGIGFRFSQWFGRHEDAALDFFRRSLPGLAAAALLLGLAIRAGGPLREAWRTSRLAGAAPGTPDVLFVVIDALRADHVHSNGYERPTSPVLDSLAASGVSFQAAISTAPYTAPAHGSLLTGLLPGEHGVQWRDRSPVLDRRNPTLPERLLEAGYRTAAFSANRFWFTREQGFGRGFLHFEDRYNHAGDMFARTAYGRKVTDLLIKRFFLDYPWRKSAHDVTNSLLDWVADDGRPFFAFLNYFDVHDPYLPPEPYRSRFADGRAPGGLINSWRGSYYPELSAEETRAEIAAYDGALSYVDAELGRLLAGLRERGRADDLLIVVTSDHGEAFGEHGNFIHAHSLYLEELHVPLVIARDGRLPAGSRPDRPVTTASLPATVLELAAGLPSDPAMAPSLSGLWQDSTVAAGWPAPVSQMERWPWMEASSPSHSGDLASIMDRRYHYILHDSLGSALFDWRRDPAEQEDLTARTEHAPALRGLGAQLDEALRPCPAIRPGCAVPRSR
jgi:arylsulfatase A-like enzyme